MKHLNKLIIVGIILSLSMSSHSQTIEADAIVGEENLSYENKNPKEELSDIELAASNNKGFGDGTYFLFIGASGASSTYSTADHAYAGGGCMQINSGSGLDGDFDLNLQLPDGHTIGGIRYFYYDDNAGNSSISLFKFDGEGGLTLLYSNFSDTDTGYGSVFTTPNPQPIVDNSTGSYTLRFNTSQDGNSQRVCGVRIVMLSNN